MARRITQVHSENLVQDTTAPKAYITQVHSESLLADSTTPKANLTQVHAESLLSDTTTAKANLTQVHAEILIIELPPPPLDLHFLYMRAITIDHTKVGGSDLTDYPVMVAGTYSYLATLANGGKVTSSQGYDICFFADTGMVTALPFDREQYLATTGEMVFFVKIPTVSATVDTVFYMVYGNAAVVDDYKDRATWNSSYKAVYHLGGNTSISLLDSTSTRADLTNTGAAVSIAGPRVGLAAALDGTDDRFIAGAALVSTASVTVQFWSYVATGDGRQTMLFSFGNDSTPSDRTSLHGPWNDSVFYWDHGNATTGQGRVTLSYTPYFSVWTHFSLVFNDATDLHAIYANGALVASHTHASMGTAGRGPMMIAFYTPTGTYHKGRLDEFRYSDSARSAGWILADYNNQNSPSTFYTIGAEGAPSSGPPPAIINNPM